jgi:hypothetical protein
MESLENTAAYRLTVIGKSSLIKFTSSSNPPWCLIAKDWFLYQLTANTVEMVSTSRMAISDISHGLANGCMLSINCYVSRTGGDDIFT